MEFLTEKQLLDLLNDEKAITFSLTSRFKGQLELKKGTNALKPNVPVLLERVPLSVDELKEIIKSKPQRQHFFTGNVKITPQYVSLSAPVKTALNLNLPNPEGEKTPETEPVVETKLPDVELKVENISPIPVVEEVAKTEKTSKKNNK